MLEELLRHLNNYFVVNIYTGDYVIEGSEISLPFLQQGQYYRIIGSVFNDGVYQYGHEQLINESFHGAVCALAVPQAVINIAEEISTWVANNAVSGAYQSESFGGYSYQRATDKNGNPVTWQSAFANRLNQWRKI